MTSIRRIFRLFAFASASACLSATAAMTQLTASKGEVTDLLTTSTTVVYAATQGGGIYKSTNAGASWSRLSALPSRVRYVNRLAGRDGSSVVYAATTVGVFKTTDAGTSWTQVYGANTATVAVDPTTDNSVLIGVKGLGILRSTDAGANWTLTSGYDSGDVTSIVFQSSATVWAGFDSNNKGGNWGGVFKSTDGGASWAAPSMGQPANKFVKTVAVDSSDNVYAGTFDGANGGIYRSASGTGAWSLMGTGVMGGGSCGACPLQTAGIQTLHKDKAVAGRMWAGSGPNGYSFWRLDGSTWVYANQDQDKFSTVGAIATFTGTANRVLVAIRGLGVYLSTNGAAGFPGLTLATSNIGLTADRVNSLTNPTAGTIYMGLTGGSVQKTTDSVNWTTLRSGFEKIKQLGGTSLNTNVLTEFGQIFSVEQVAASSVTPSTVYAAVLGRGLYRSTDSGSTWNPVTEAGLDNSPIHPVPLNLRPRGLLVESPSLVYYSIFEKPDGDGNTTNDNAGFYKFNGSTWTRVLAGPSVGNSGASKIVKASNNNYYALINGDPSYKSTDGTNFTAYSNATVPHTGFAPLYFIDLDGHPTSTATQVAATNKGLYRTTDGGVNWSVVSTNAPVTNFSAVQYAANGTLLAGTLEGGLYCSTDNGTTFSAKTLPGTWAYSAVTGIVRSGSNVFYLTDGNGAWLENAPTCP